MGWDDWDDDDDYYKYMVVGFGLVFGLGILGICIGCFILFYRRRTVQPAYSSPVEMTSQPYQPIYPITLQTTNQNERNIQMQPMIRRQETPIPPQNSTTQRSSVPPLISVPVTTPESPRQSPTNQFPHSPQNTSNLLQPPANISSTINDEDRPPSYNKVDKMLLG